MDNRTEARVSHFITLSQNPANPNRLPAGAAHLAFPAPSREAVGKFFMAALKAGGRVHGEPKLRDPESGYYSAAIIDSNGNSVEAVYRPGHSSARSAVSSSIDSTVSITTKSSSRASSRTQTTVPSRSEARSHTSRASTKVERPHPSEKPRDLREPRESRESRDSRDSRDPREFREARESRESRESRGPRESREPRDMRESREPRESRGSKESTASSNSRRGSSTAQAQAYAAQQRDHPQREQQQQSDGSSRAAKTLVGSLIGAAAGAALAYAWSGNNSQSPSSEDTASQPTQPTQPAQPTQSGQSAQQPPRERTYQQAPSSRSSSQTAQTLPIRAIEAGGSYFPPKQPDPPRPGLTRSVTSKNPRASTIYEGSEYGGKSEASRTYLDDSGRRASDGGAAFGLPDIANLPLRAIEYPPPTYSKANEPSRAIDDKRSMYSASTARPSNASYQYQYQDDRDRNRDSAYALSHSNSNNNKNNPNSTASRTPRNIPLPDSIASYRPSNASGSGTDTGSYTSARGAPLTEGSLASFRSNSTVPIPESVVNVDVDTDVTPDDSVSQISSNAHRSKAMPRQMPAPAPARSGVSASALSKRSSRFEEPVRPDDSISQVSCNSRSTARAGGGERRSQAV